MRPDNVEVSENKFMQEWFISLLKSAIIILFSYYADCKSKFFLNISRRSVMEL